MGVKSSLKIQMVENNYYKKTNYLEDTIPPFTNPFSFPEGASPFLKLKIIETLETKLRFRPCACALR